MALLMANPSYDCALRYLLRDNELAREWLGIILDRKISSLEVQPYCATPYLRDCLRGLLRMDFAAVIEAGAGEPQQVLLRVCKAKHQTGIINELLILAGEFATTATDDIFATIKSPLPPVSIYFLGFTLAQGYPAVFKVDEAITDLLTGESPASPSYEPFVKLLTHESYVIQIPLLEALWDEPAATPLAEALLIFAQEPTEKWRYLRRTREPRDPLARRLADRLTLLVAEEHSPKQMDIEEELERTAGQLVRESSARVNDLVSKKMAAQAYGNSLLNRPGATAAS